YPLQISHFATCACLSNRNRFPSFFRTIPSDYYQSRALAQLVKHFGWTWVGTIRSDNDYGNYGMATFVEAAQELGICIEYSAAISETYPIEKLLKTVDVIKRSTAKVVIAFLARPDMTVLLTELFLHNVTGLQWIGSEAWITARNYATAEGYKVLTGSIGFTMINKNIDGLREFFMNLQTSQVQGNALINKYWETALNCSLSNQNNTTGIKPCTGSESLRELKNRYADISQMRIYNNVYKSVYAVAYSLHNLITCKKGQGPFSNHSCAKIIPFKPWQVRFNTAILNCPHTIIYNSMYISF
ncbi:vomeronasal type-2 receptor 1-like, partial [Amia ocellicauda]|uniref:vomeronasal type-2 receptor 1-like n=1 Tax=Amia ocellicauda TaxID=2972642 RepID=UPI00346395AF